MSDAWSVFTNSISLAFNNYGRFIKIWLSTLLVVFLLFVLIAYFNRNTLGLLAMAPEMLVGSGQGLGGLGFGFFLVGLIYFIAICGCAVNSFRFYLGEYRANWVPFQFDWGTTFAVIGWSIVLGLIVIAAIIIPVIIAVFLLGLAAQSQSGFLTFIGFLVYLAAIVFAMWVALRLQNKIIGRCIGKQISFGESWNRTKGSGLFYLGIVVLLFVFTFLISFVLELVIGLVFGLILNLFLNSMVMVSILGILVFVLYIMVMIFLLGFQFSIYSQIYTKFFGSGDDVKVFA